MKIFDWPQCVCMHLRISGNKTQNPEDWIKGSYIHQ